MRAELTKKANTKHDDICRSSVAEDNTIVFHCTETCAVKVLGGGNSSEGVTIVLTAIAKTWKKYDNRKRRLKRKKRRGWA